MEPKSPAFLRQEIGGIRLELPEGCIAELEYPTAVVRFPDDSLSMSVVVIDSDEQMRWMKHAFQGLKAQEKTDPGVQLVHFKALIEPYPGEEVAMFVRRHHSTSGGFALRRLLSMNEQELVGLELEIGGAGRYADHKSIVNRIVESVRVNLAGLKLARAKSEQEQAEKAAAAAQVELRDLPDLPQELDYLAYAVKRQLSENSVDPAAEPLASLAWDAVDERFRDENAPVARADIDRHSSQLMNWIKQDEESRNCLNFLCDILDVKWHDMEEQ